MATSCRQPARVDAAMQIPSRRPTKYDGIESDRPSVALSALSLLSYSSAYSGHHACQIDPNIDRILLAPGWSDMATGMCSAESMRTD